MASAKFHKKLTKPALKARMDVARHCVAHRKKNGTCKGCTYFRLDFECSQASVINKYVPALTDRSIEEVFKKRERRGRSNSRV